MKLYKYLTFHLWLFRLRSRIRYLQLKIRVSHKFRRWCVRHEAVLVFASFIALVLAVTALDTFEQSMR